MRLRYIITILLFGSLLSGAAAGIMLYAMNPMHSPLIPILFLFCIGFSVSGIIAVILLSFRALKKQTWHIRTNITTSIRQGLIIGITVMILLILSHFSILTMPISMLVILSAAGFEYFAIPAEFREIN